MDMNKRQMRQRLLQLIKEKALFYQPVTLSSGKKSSYYVDLRRITLCAEGAYLTAQLILDLVREEKVDVIGGPTLGADPILGAVSCLSYLRKIPLDVFIVRREQKKHGMQKFIEGPSLEEGMRVMMVDDVVTTGGSIIKAAHTVRELGCEVVKVVVLVDREEGGKEALQKEELTLLPLFTARDLGVST